MSFARKTYKIKRGSRNCDDESAEVCVAQECFSLLNHLLLGAGARRLGTRAANATGKLCGA
jgi:hypothetical protein